MRALALDAAINDGSTTTTTFGILRGFLTRGAAFFFIPHFSSDFVQIQNEIIERKISIKGCNERRQPGTVFSQRKIFLLPRAGLHLGRVNS